MTLFFYVVLRLALRNVRVVSFAEGSEGFGKDTRAARLYSSQNCRNQKSQFGKRRAPKNDEDPSHEILDMRSISVKNMKWNFGNM